MAVDEPAGKGGEGGKDGGKSGGKGKRGGGKGRNKGSRGGKGWGKKGGYDGEGAWGDGGFGAPWGELMSPFDAHSFEGTWLDSLGNEVRVEGAGGPRGPLTAYLARPGGREQALSLRHDGQTGLWACGNAVLDASASADARRVWVAFDGKRSVWQRRDQGGKAAGGDRVGAADADGAVDLLPWLLIPEYDGTAAEEAGGGDNFDGGRISAVLDVRQVFGNDYKSQDLFSEMLLDHGLIKGPGGDPIVPAVDSPLWERLAEGPRRNALQVFSRFHAAPSPCCPVVMADGPPACEVHVGRHRFQVTDADFQALDERWMGEDEGHLRKTAAMAHVLALYRMVESPLLQDGQRGILQRSTEPSVRQSAGVEYEIFASPLNACVPNGHFGSRWPHVESLFGSAGSYPDVIDKFPKGAVVGVHPPFTSAYLDHLMGDTLDRILKRFRKVQLVVPVREASWRPKLHRLSGAEFVTKFWDASALRIEPAQQPVFCWLGSELGPAS
eukprot:TRINITY_DN24794_c0_g1_i1.p1 TRINITY_DN24794_c0_g1~~TRINITY_DN24794_c0_g1_i1.p1  ORF type:complete len:522 (-),score=104.14 TRINITY_DN24794_c0_g1_i1:189-1679(-)